MQQSVYKGNGTCRKAKETTSATPVTAVHATYSKGCICFSLKDSTKDLRGMLSVIMFKLETDE